MTLLLVVVLSGDILQLKDRVQVRERYVSLLDIVDEELLSLDAKVLARRVWLGRAPEPGKTRIIRAQDVLRELEARGYDPKAFTIRGEQVQVGAVADSDADSGSVRLAERLIALEIRNHLVHRHGFSPSDIRVTIIDTHPDGLPGDLDVLEIVAKEAKTAGPAAFEAVLSNGKESIRASVVANIVRTREVAVARHDLPVGRKLTRADCELRRIECDSEDVFASVEELVDARVIARIAGGQVIRAADVQLRPIVKRGDLVKAGGRFVRGADARVLEEGRIGQVITCEFTGTKARFKARVISANAVEVVEEGK